MTDAAPIEPQGAPLEPATSEPREITNQVPQEPAPEPKKPVSISDAIKQAQADVEAKAKPAEPKPAEVKAEPAKADAKPAAEKPAEPAKAPEPTAAEVEARRNSPHREPPGRFDDAAKAEWERAPEAVKGAVHRAFREMEAGIQKHKAAAEEFESVREFSELAKQHGTDLKSALANYVGIERKLQQDPLGGLQQIVSNLGLKGPNGQPITLRDIAAHILGQPADQVAAQSEAHIQALQREIAELKQQFGGVSQTIQQQRAASVANEVEAFRAQPEYARFDELQDQIAAFLQSGLSNANLPPRERLREAYEYASFRNPAPTPAAQTGIAPPLAQTQPPAPTPVNPAGQKSISGAPGHDTHTPGKPKVMSIKESIAAAMRG